MKYQRFISRLTLATVVAGALAIAACAGGNTLPPTSPAMTGGNLFAAPDNMQIASDPREAADDGVALTPPTAGHTSFWSIVVEDPSGTPLRHQHVALYPWNTGCKSVTAYKATCPAAIATTRTTRKGHFGFSNIADDDYLLVIGSDSPSDLTYATVHDHIRVTGGTVHLLAPVLPKVTGNKVKPRPAVELNGDYRLMKLTSAQAPCLQGWQQWRASQNVAGSVGDEWLFENSRDYVGWLNGNMATTPSYLTSAETQADTSGPCQTAVANLAIPTNQWNSAFGKYDWFTDPRTLWFGAYYAPTSKCCHQFYEEYPIDPRSYPDPNPSLVPPWP